MPAIEKYDWSFQYHRVAIKGAACKGGNILLFLRENLHFKIAKFAWFSNISSFYNPHKTTLQIILALP